MKVYTFGDLRSKEAKQAAVEWWLNSQSGRDYDCSDSISYEFEQRLEEEGLPTKMGWSLGYCQGDGVAFWGPVNVERYTTFHQLRHWGPLEEWIYAKINHSGRYYHANSMTVDIEESFEDSDHPLTWWSIRFLKEFEEHLQQRVIDKSHELERAGYDEIEHTQSYEYVSELLDANGYEFNYKGEPAA